MISKGVVGSEKLLCIPDFNLYDLNKVLEFRLCWKDEGFDVGWYEVLLKMLYSCEAGEYEIDLKFLKVRHVRVPEVAGVLYLTELECEDVAADQLEGVKYRLVSYGMAGFEIMAGDMLVVDCVAL